MSTHKKSNAKLAPAVFCATAFVLIGIAAQDAATDDLHAAALSPAERQELIVQVAKGEIEKGVVWGEVERWFAL